MKTIKRSIIGIIAIASVLCLCADSANWHWFLATKALGLIGLALAVCIASPELWEEE